MSLVSEAERLLRRDADWVAATEGRDVERILEFWTDDAVVYPPGLPVIAGKAALRAYVESSLAVPGFRITWSSSTVRLSPDHRLGYLLSQNAVTVPGTDGKPRVTRGRAVTIWRLEPDGQWRCAVDIWNADPGDADASLAA